ncbi:MAG: hypothetical protein QM809_01070 [Gordonia sp. (in: high G+C Gram-positive bacteria)]
MSGSASTIPTAQKNLDDTVHPTKNSRVVEVTTTNTHQENQ